MKNLFLLVCIAIVMLTSCKNSTSASGHRNDSKIRFKVQQLSNCVDLKKNDFAPTYIVWADSVYKSGEVVKSYVSELGNITDVLLLERIK